MENHSKPVNIIIADHNMYTAKGYKLEFSRCPFFNKIHIVNNADELNSLPVEKWNIFLFNWYMPELDLNVQRKQLEQKFPGIKLIAYTREPYWIVHEKVKNKLIHGYMLENTHRPGIEKIISMVLSDKYATELEILVYLENNPSPVTVYQELEFPVYESLIAGAFIGDVANEVNKSDKTIYRLRKIVINKAGANSEGDFLFQVLKKGWLSIEDFLKLRQNKKTINNS